MRLLLAIGCVLLLAACVHRPPACPADPPRAYRLPFEKNTCRLCVQGGPGPLSHRGRERYAIDFRMPVGTPVLAARAGTVVAVKEDSNVGGSDPSYADRGNYVRIRHADSTHGVYLHLRYHGAVVETGDRVVRGQHIAWSGNTGWSSMPHLHFQVDAKDVGGRWTSIPVAFQDVKAHGVPQMFKWYVSGNAGLESGREGPRQEAVTGLRVR